MSTQASNYIFLNIVSLQFLFRENNTILITLNLNRIFKKLQDLDTTKLLLSLYVCLNQAGRKRYVWAKLKIVTGNTQAQSVIITKNKTGENKEFTPVRKTAKFIGIHLSYVAKCMKKQKFYKVYCSKKITYLIYVVIKVIKNKVYFQ